MNSLVQEQVIRPRPVTAAKASSEGSRRPGKACRNEQMDVL